MTIDRERILTICRLIQERQLKVHWIAMGRVDTVDEELLSAMRKAGCDNIYLGVESGSQRVLDAMDKGSTVVQAREATRRLRAHGMRACWFIQLGYPGEEWPEILLTRDLLRGKRS